MEKISKISSHNKNTYYYLLINALQRASFYGSKVLLFTLLIGQAFNKTSEQAAIYLTTIISIYIISRVIGALIGDLVLGNKTTAIIGGICQTIGILLLLVAPNNYIIYSSISLISFGSGIFAPNWKALYGKLHLSKTRILDGAFTMYYTSVNFGAILGIVFIGAIGASNLKLGIIIAAICVLFSTWLLSTQRETINSERYQTRYQSYKSRNIYILLTVILISLFWLIYEFAGKALPDLQMKFSENVFFNSDHSTWFSAYSDSFVLIVGLIFSIIWSYFYTTPFTKISIGFLLTALAFFLLLNTAESIADGGNITVISLLLLSLGEIFMAPAIYSALTKFSNPKYLAINISLAKLPTLFLGSLCTLVPTWISSNEFLSFKIIVLSLLTFGIISYFLFKIINMDRMKKSMSQL